MASTARIDELKKKFDENPRRYFAPLANEFRKAGDVEQAIMICEEFLPQQPGHMSGHIVYGQALFDLGRLDESRTVFETALTLDPENLIALRHLGDIARAHGDLELARRWYERVLEADPRNEEVQQVIAALGAGAAPAAEPPRPADASYAPQLPESVDFGIMAGAAAAPPPLPIDEPPALLEHDFVELDVVEEHALPEPASRMMAPPPDLAFGSISVEGLEPTSSSHGPPAATDRAEGLEPMEFTAPAPADATSALDAELESGEFSAPAAPVAPLAGLEESAMGAFERLPEHYPPPLPDLEPLSEGETGAPIDIPPAVIAAEAELLDERGESEPAGAPEAGGADSERPAAFAEARPHPTPTQPFVTETMAELYVKQGFREQALDVYTLLLAASPDNARLKERVAALQPEVVVDSGPNVREFFARIAARRPGERETAAAPPSDDDFADFASFETIPPAERASARPIAAAEPPAAPSGADGSIDALFGNRPAGTSEDSAASALAQAFGGSSEPAPLTGRPARAAAGELSLDSVFRDGGARPPRGSQSFSFDQFFSESATERPSEPSPTQTPSQGVGAHESGDADERNSDDIEQFNSWLQGLKQR